MERKELKERLLSIIENEPGVTLNGMFAHVKDDLNGKFPPMYVAVKELKSEGKVKVDGKKKNTGHYLPDAAIPDSVPKASINKTSSGSQVTFVRPKKKNLKRFVLEKREGERWIVIDDNDDEEEIAKLFKSVCRAVPLHYKITDTKENKLIYEREAITTLPHMTEVPDRLE